MSTIRSSGGDVSSWMISRLRVLSIVQWAPQVAIRALSPSRRCQFPNKGVPHKYSRYVEEFAGVTPKADRAMGKLSVQKADS